MDEIFKYLSAGGDGVTIVIGYILIKHNARLAAHDLELALIKQSDRLRRQQSVNSPTI